MQISVNGQPRELPESMTVLELLDQLELQPRRVAVEQNKKIVRRSNFGQAPLAEGDRIEIVTLVGGG